MDAEHTHLDHRDALALAEATERVTRAAITPSDRFIYTTWALAWPLAFGARWITAGNAPVIDASWIGNLVYGVCIVAGVSITATHHAKRARGVTGTSTRLGRSWALVWIAGFGACVIITAGIGNVVASDAAVDLVVGCLITFTVAMIYTAAGATIDDRILSSTGLWLLAVCAAAALVGPYTHLLVIAVGGAVGFISAAAASRQQR